MMIGRLAGPDGSAGRGVSALGFSCALRSCAFRPLATDAAIAEPRNPRRLMDMNSVLRNRRKDNTGGDSISRGRPHSVVGTVSDLPTTHPEVCIQAGFSIGPVARRSP